ncbi:MAG: tRNA lysidine(34) synthetase TilS [Planctomycetaceae bacterium]|nr:tRNA lysidine(34) synthetase TilS [Planctomycetaceae bacterium]
MAPLPPQSPADPLDAAVAAFIDAHALLAPHAPAVVAVSGGADSVAMLSVLRSLSALPDRDYRLTVAHLNHALRPQAADEEAFVVELARSWDLPVIHHRADAAAHAQATGQSIETAARELRYEFFAAAATEAHAHAVAVGHHADDNVETVLQRIARGSHLRGLAGIPPLRKMEGAGPTIVRPLLACRRKDIEDYCRRKQLAWCTDESNANTELTRNFIRHELLPLLRTRLNGQADDAILRLSAEAAKTEDYLATRARQAIEASLWSREANAIVLERRPLGTRSRLIQQYAIRIALEDVGVPMQTVTAERINELVETLLGHGPAVISLPGQFTARRENDSFIIQHRPDEPPQPPPAVELACPGTTLLADGREVTCSIEPMDPVSFEIHCHDTPPGVELLDAAKICGRLVCRPRRTGDAFRPLGCDGSQSVSDFLTNIKAAPAVREAQICICDDEGIVCLAGFRIDQRVSIGDNTKQILRIEVTRP